MGAILIAFNAVLPLFLVIFAGFIFSKTRVASNAWVDILNKFALWIGYPALIINLLSKVDFYSTSWFNLIWINSVYIVICIFLSFPYSKLSHFQNTRRRTLFLAISYGNVAYLGIPVLQFVLGEKILPVAGIISAVYVFWLLTLGLFLVEYTGEKQFDPLRLAGRLVRNPLLISVFAGIAIAALQIKLPGTIEKSVSMISLSVTPVVLFSLGIFMGFQKLGYWREWKAVAIFTVFIMIIFPGVFYLAVAGRQIAGFDVNASILEAAMPLGLTPYALSHQYNLDTAFAARVVLFSTTLSLIILPLWIVFLGV